MSRARLALIQAILVLMLAGCARAVAQSTPPATSTAAAQPATATQRPPPILTPFPVRTEEPLTGASSSVPPIFEGVSTYRRIAATLSVADANEWTATTLEQAASAVVQIWSHGDIGGDVPVGSGVVIHPSGLILTANHVLLVNPDDPNSRRYDAFVIATNDDPQVAPQPRYLAHLVAAKPEQDLALLAIDRTIANQALDPQGLRLHALPLDDASLFGAQLYVLGFRATGNEAVGFYPVNFRRFEEQGNLVVVNEFLEPGNSGGPALVNRGGRFAVAALVIRRRSAGGSLSQESLLRTVGQLRQLAWSPGNPRAWAENMAASTDGDRLQFTLTLNTLDMEQEPLQLFLYATDSSGRPWQPPNAPGPLVLWVNITPGQPFARQTLTLTVGAATLSALPGDLYFRPLLWHERQGAQPIFDAPDAGLPVLVGAIATVATGPQAANGAAPSPSAPPPTAVATESATGTPTEAPTTTATETPALPPSATPDLAATQTAEEGQFATAIAATLTARFTPTPTATSIPDFEQRLATAVAATLAAEATPTPSPTATFTPAPSNATRTIVVTQTPMPTSTLTADSRQPLVAVEAAKLTAKVTSSSTETSEVFLSVYRIVARECKQEPNQRMVTGFHVQQLRGIVTVLHGVIGCKSITATQDGDNALLNHLTISQVDISRDLALLHSEEVAHITHGGFDVISVPSSQDFVEAKVVGYPISIIGQVTTDVSIEKMTKLADAIPHEVYTYASFRNSPSPDLQIYIVERYLLPGYSGAPVLTQDGQVLAIVNTAYPSGSVKTGIAIPWNAPEWASVESVAEKFQRLEAINLDYAISVAIPPDEITPTP